MTYVKKLILTIIFCSLFNWISAQEAQLKSVYIFNFTKLVEWPDDSSQENFVIGIIGKTPVSIMLNTIARKRKVGNRKIIVKEFDIHSIEYTHILFVPKEYSSFLPSILESRKNSKTLIVTEAEGPSGRGGMINFVIRSNHLRFELNKTKAIQAQLKISKELENLAILVR